MSSEHINLTDRQLAGVRQILAGDKRIVAAYLLGSVLTERFRPDSDVDLAILPAAGVEFAMEARLLLAAEVEGAVGRTVDVGVLDHRNLVYAAQAIATGLCIHSRDDASRDVFAATTLSMYAALRQEREAVEHAYTTR